MAIRRRFDGEYDYTLDDEYEDMNEYDNDDNSDDYDDEPKEDKSAINIIKDAFSGLMESRRRKRAAENEEEDEEENEEEYINEDEEENEDDNEVREKRTNKRISSKSTRRSKSSNNREGDYNDRREYDEEEYEYTDEELDRYDKKFGTKGSSRRADFKRQTKERISLDGSVRRTRKNNTTSSPSWSEYRGSVRNIIEATPKNMDHIQEIAEKLKDDYAAIINLNDMITSKSSAISFIDGVSFILEYRFECIGEGYYICAPIGFMIPFEFRTYSPKNKR